MSIVAGVLTSVLIVASLNLSGCATSTRRYVHPSVQAFFDAAARETSLGDVQKARAHYENGLTQANAHDDQLGMGIALFALGNIYRGSNDHKNASTAFASSLERLAAAKDPLSEASTLHAIAYFEYQDGNYERSINLIDRALPIWEALILGAKTEEQVSSFVLVRAGEYILRAESNAKLKQFDAALENFQSAISDHRAIGDKGKLGASLYLAANVLRMDLKQPQNSIPYYIEAAPLLEGSDDFVTAADAYLALGIIYQEMGKRDNYERSAEFLKKAVRITTEKGVTARIGYAHLILARSLEELGQYENALSEYELFLRHDRDLGGGDYTNPAHYEFLETKAQIYRNLSRYEEAIANYQTALLKRTETGDESRQALISTMLAEIYSWIGDSDRATLFYKRALEIYKRQGDTINQIDVLSALGEQWVSGDVSPAEAVEYFSSASTLLNSVKGLNLLTTLAEDFTSNMPDRDQLDAFVKEQLRPFEPWSLMVAGKFFQRAGRTLGAMGNVDDGLLFLSLAFKYHQAITPLLRDVVTELAKDWYFFAEGQRRKRMFDEALKSLGMAEEIAKFLQTPEIHWIYAAIARTHEDLGEDKAALAYYKKGLDVLESIHQQQGTEEVKIGVFAGALYAYNGLVPLLLKLHQSTGNGLYVDEAFQTTERLKARAFREMFATYRGSREGGELGQLTSKTDKIAIEMRMVSKKLGVASVGSIEANRLLDRLDELQKSLNNLRLEEGKHNPAYAEIFFPIPVTLKQVQQSLSADTALLEYTIGDRQVVLWTITKEAAHYNVINKTEKTILAEFLKTLREPLLTTAETSNHISLGEQLYNTLLAPAEKHWRDKTHLIIVPDGDLYYLPFETLIRSGTKKPVRLAEVPYLIKQLEISYISSAAVLLRQASQAKDIRPKLPLIAFGDPIYKTEISQVKEGQQPSPLHVTLRGHEFKPLEFSGEEVRRIASIWDISPSSDQINLKEKASVERIKNMDLTKYHILHFASHAILSDKFSLSSQPALVLSGDVNNQMLQFSDILGLKLNADLVVLSACETGLGQLRDGEGIIGLTRAFFYAGAASAVVSLWKVEDQSTALLMEKFYQRLKAGQNRAEALRGAKLDIISSHVTLRSTRTNESLSAPFFWAPFILIGDSEPIQFN
jgi:CHAT domain-containing protein